MVVACCLGVVLCTFVALRIHDWIAWHNQQIDSGFEPLTGLTPSPENFAPLRAVPRPPLVSDFETMSAALADAILEDDELVVGVEVNGEARAYPINMLTGPDREIINDELGGRAISATW